MNKKLRTIFILVIAAIFLMSGIAQADDGFNFVKNVSGTPDEETERANIGQMNFYVPMQNANGRLLVEGEDTATMYYIKNDDYPEKYLWETRGYAKPLVAVYIDALPEEDGESAYQILSGAGFGEHDAYAAVSLDDGHTWNRTNLSNSAHLSSFTLADGTPYPGDAHNMTFAIADDMVLVGWISKYCVDGSPAYKMKAEDIVALQTEFGLPDLYVHDIWGVNGHQGSVDYTLQGFPEVGEMPYSCVWAARGQLLPVTLSPENDPHEGYEIIWLDAERLTSGERDANRLEMAGDVAAGFMMTWQEDPEGLRPGQGLGPGEGWSGAVVNQDTDLWYSFISAEHFDLVQDSQGLLEAAIPLSQYIEEGIETRPSIAVPMAVPMRLTDNAKCKGDDNSPAYCYIDFDDDNPWLTDLGATDGVLPEFVQSTDSTLCSEVVQWTNPGGETLDLCQAEDGRVLGGRVGASRPRVNVQPYNSAFIADDPDDDSWYDSGIVIMGAEESKALGSLQEDPDIDVIEIGKNMWYYSFDLLNPSFVMQGGMLNWPAKDPLTGDLYDMLEDDFGNMFYETEITRRFSHMSQAIHQIGESGVSSVLIVKQGILNQGGPADIFLRFTKVDTELFFICDADGDGFAEEQCLPEGYNPYAYQNLVCENWEYDDGNNPRYIEGLCVDTGTNVSSVSSTCNGGDCGEFPWDGGVEFPKVTEWDQTEENLLDESWNNPWDVAKGHRGFIDGDFIMVIYAWSPNWKANAIGNDHYNLYARRSFDGGATWTTTPADLGGDGTCTTEYFGTGDTKSSVETCYGAGEFEKARNLSQLTSNRETILDPRYTPTGGLKMLTAYDKYDLATTMGAPLPYVDDAERDSSKFFIVYETGDNTTVAEGEATPLDLYYSRAYNYGDDYDLIEKSIDGGSDTMWVFDSLERDPDILSGEAANTCNAKGTFYYAIWNQWKEDAEENVSESDAIMARAMWIPDEEDTSYLPPIVRIYASHTYVPADDTEVTLTGLIYKVYGDKEIVAWKWTSSLDGELSGEKIMTVRGDQLSIGRHTISLSAQDSGGLWSYEVSVPLQVGSKIFIPMVNH
jgi:hypothetical protein